MSSGDFRFLHGGHAASCRARVDKHFEGYWALQYLTRGDVELYCDSTRHRISGSGLWFCWPGPRIRFHAGPSDRWDHRYIAFTGSLAGQWQRDGLIVHQPQKPPEGRDFTQRFDRLLALAFRPDRWGPWRARNLLEGLLLEMAEARSPAANAPPDWLAEVRTALQHCSETGPDYDALADRCGMALSTLRRKFKQAMGLSMHRYHLRARTDAACGMLLDTDLPVKDIARRLGYRDVYFFSRQFKAQTGLPPATYRRSGLAR